jgi:D-alanyl-D-alanine carboxypeptidase (penicillin-binding protein 5/6)
MQFDLKNTFLKTILVTFLCILWKTSSVEGAIINASLDSKAGLLMDVSTEQIIASKDSQERLPIASISKIIVIYLTEQAISDGKMTHNTKVSINSKIANFSQNTSVANTPMTQKHQYTVKQLETAALLPSSNAAAMALAQQVAGSQTKYYRMAEELLNKWGIKNVTIYSASGLRDGDLGDFNSSKTDDDAENMLSAREVAIVARRLIMHFPQILEITQRPSALFPEPSGTLGTITNSDKLLTQSAYCIQGLKTGTTSNNGANFVGVEMLKGRQVISVTLNGFGNSNFTDTERLLMMTDENTEIRKIREHNKVIINNAKNSGGKVSVVSDPIKLFVPKNQTPRVYKTNSGKKLDMATPINHKTSIEKLPLTFKQAGLNDFLTEKYLKYYPEKDVKKANFIVRIYRKIAS